MRVVHGMFWWVVTIITLFILDDLLFGPLFWAIALWSQQGSTAIAFMASVIFQNWLINACLKEHPSRMAKFFLERLMLQRKNEEIAEREESVKRTVTSAAGAIAVTPLIGAVIPTLLLNKRQRMDRKVIKPFSFFLTLIYGTEFALLHGGYGFGALVRALL